MPQYDPHLPTEDIQVPASSKVEVQISSDPIRTSRSLRIGLLREHPINRLATKMLNHECFREPRHPVASLMLVVIVDGAGFVITK